MRSRPWLVLVLLDAAAIRPRRWGAAEKLEGMGREGAGAEQALLARTVEQFDCTLAGSTT